MNMEMFDRYGHIGLFFQGFENVLLFLYPDDTDPYRSEIFRATAELCRYSVYIILCTSTYCPVESSFPSINCPTLELSNFSKGKVSPDLWTYFSSPEAKLSPKGFLFLIP